LTLLSMAALVAAGCADDSGSSATTPSALCQKAAGDICDVADAHCHVCSDRGICGLAVLSGSMGMISGPPGARRDCINWVADGCQETEYDVAQWGACIDAVQADADVGSDAICTGSIMGDDGYYPVPEACRAGFR